MKLHDGALIVLAAHRLTRLVTTDDLGLWLIREPAYRWAARVDPDRTGWQTKAVSGLDCAYCVGYWIGAGVLASYALVGRRRPWRFLARSLALNTTVTTLNAGLDLLEAPNGSSE